MAIANIHRMTEKEKIERGILPKPPEEKETKDKPGKKK